MASKVVLPMTGYQTDMENNVSLDIQKKPVNDMIHIHLFLNQLSIDIKERWTNIILCSQSLMQCLKKTRPISSCFFLFFCVFFFLFPSSCFLLCILEQTKLYNLFLLIAKWNVGYIRFCTSKMAMQTISALYENATHVIVDTVAPIWFTVISSTPP